MIERIKPGIPYYRKNIWIETREMLDKLGYQNNPDFISLAYRINPSIESKLQEYKIERREAVKRGLAINTVVDKILEELEEEEYLICVEVEDLIKYLESTRDGPKLYRELEQYLENFTKPYNRKKTVCILNVTEEEFIQQHGITPKRILEKIFAEGSKSYKVYKFIKGLKIL